MYQVQRRLRSQNFIIDRELVNRLIRASSISSSDLVLDIGAGRGVITRGLLSVARQVIAIELDLRLFNKLKLKFWLTPHLQLIHTDFLRYPLPTRPYKVFANIPFSITGDIIRRLLMSSRPPADCCLVVQAEAAAKFVTHQGRNTLAAILYYPFWDIRVVHRFAKVDFRPIPAVDCVLLRLSPRATPFLPRSSQSLYWDFVAYTFTHDRFASFVSPSRWLQLFNRFQKTSPPSRFLPIQGTFARLQSEQSHLTKIHRTRTDPRWPKFTA